MNKKFHGVLTALITPFDDKFKVDFDVYEKMIKFQMHNGVSGLVSCGTTAESPCLSYEEQLESMRRCVNLSAGKVSVIAGVGSNNTEKVCHLAKEAEKIGVDALLVIAPYYNRPSPDGLVEHYKSISASVSIPIILYNHPGRTGVDIKTDTIERLSNIKNVIGIKDVSGDVNRPLEVRRKIGEDFLQFSGDDISNLSFYANGGHGAISVASNIVPKEMVAIYNFAKENNFEDALKAHSKFYDLYQGLSCETNPVPVKYSAELMGFCKSKVRLPLVELSSSNKSKVKNILSELNLI